MSLAGALMASVLAAPAFAEQPVTDERLINADAEPQNWLTTLQNYSSHRYSRLDSINRGNVAGLKVAFTFPIPSAFAGRTGSTIDTNPLVDEGIMYFDDGAGMFYKLDVSSGTGATLVWNADSTMAKDVTGNTRGLALIDNMVVKCLRDGRTVAVDRDSGEFVWDVQSLGIEHPEGAGINVESEACTGGTVAMGGHILISNGLGDRGTRGFVQAVDPENGDEIWRWYAIPGPGQPGHETWTDDHNAWKTGGGGMWTQGSYDPDLRMTYWGTANPVPMFDPEFRPGDNLYTDSAIALDVDSGELKWFFQYIANESWDYDENGVHFLLDREVNGQMTPVVAHWARNGLVYQFNRTNGEFINAAQYVEEVNWTAGIDPKTGKPVEYDPNLDVQTYVPATRWVRGEAVAQNEAACPNLRGGVRWQPPAYNPDTGNSYAGGSAGCFILEVIATEPIGPEGGFRVDQGGGLYGFNGNFNATGEFTGELWGMNLDSGELIGSVQRPYTFESGVTVTAGGLVLTSTVDGLVIAYDADTLDELWTFNMGIPSRGTPMLYSVGDKDYVAVLASGPVTAGTNMLRGAMLYVFSL
jgi:alcohol dehydrogenase (cytochrome c)